MALWTEPHPYTLHQTYTGHGCAHCGEFYDSPLHEAVDYWLVEGVKVPKEDDTDAAVETRA